MTARSIAVIGEFTPTFQPHVATAAAIEHSRAALGADVEYEWIPSEDVDVGIFLRFGGIWIAPGSPYGNMAKVLAAIRHARQHGVPCFGTCGGFQHMVIEYARNVLACEEAQHAEYDPGASDLFITELTCSLAGREMTLQLRPGSRAAAIYGCESVTEEYYCNFGVNPDKVSLLKTGALEVTGSDAEGEVRVIELPGHPFFIGTLFVPQTRSRPGRPHPLVTSFVDATLASARPLGRSPSPFAPRHNPP